MTRRNMEQKTKAQLRNVVHWNENAVQDEKAEAMITKLVSTIFPTQDLESEDVLQYLDKVSKWIKMMPQSLHPEKPWSRQEFGAVLMGPNDSVDPQLENYMDQYYEEYKGNSEDEHEKFYMDLFDNEEEICEIDWMSVWGNFYASYESHTDKMESDSWLSAAAESN